MKRFKEVLIPSVSLFLICLMATFLLGGTDFLTKDKIAEVAEKAAEEARIKVCSQAVSFSETESGCYIALDENGNTVGYAVTTKDKSYGGDIEVMTGFDTDGNITGIEILSIEDTPGLGMNAKGEKFRNQFIGKSGEIEVSKTPENENEVQAITGATITSNAVKRCVNAAIEILNAETAGEN